MPIDRERVCIVLLALAVTAVPGRAPAHPLAPALLEIVESEAGRADVSWRTSRLTVPGSDVRPALPAACRVLTGPQLTETAISLTERWSVQCPPEGLVGQRVAVDGLGAAKMDALLRIRLADGRLIQRVLLAREPALIVPEREPRYAVFGAYLGLGFEHIVFGPDHLLFVFGLLLLVPTTRRLIGTITAFTAGHSITLSLAALGFVNFPSRPIEVLIALTVFLLAVELARDDDAAPTLMRRLPWAMALLFGLLHGLGFAGALSEVGLPPHDIPVALFSFNAGIELGQLVFVLIVVAARHALRHVLARLPQWVESVPVYAMGTLAAFWSLERAAALFS
jgi:hydrogenase/urease accessory protein HupE